jgi:hypothetical protein
MLVKTVKQLVETVDIGENVSACKGKVKAVFKFFTGPSKRKGAKKGEVYQIQNFILQDLEDAEFEITAVSNGRDELPRDWVGKTIHLVAYNGERGLTGLKTKENKWTDKDGTEHEDKVLWITPTAEISLGGMKKTQESSEPEPDEVPNEDEPESAQDDSEPVKTQQKPKSLPPVKSATNSGQISAQEKAELDRKNIVSCKMQACRNANVWLVAALAQLEARKRYIELSGIDLTEEQFQGSIAMNAIQLFQMGVHNRMPVKLIEKEEKQPAKVEQKPKSATDSKQNPITRYDSSEEAPF